MDEPVECTGSPEQLSKRQVFQEDAFIKEFLRTGKREGGILTTGMGTAPLAHFSPLSLLA